MQCPFCKAKYNFKPGKVLILNCTIMCNKCGAILTAAFQPHIIDFMELRRFAKELDQVETLDDFLKLQNKVL